MPVHPRKLHSNSYINIIHNQIDNYYNVCPAALLINPMVIIIPRLTGTIAM